LTSYYLFSTTSIAYATETDAALVAGEFYAALKKIYACFNSIFLASDTASKFLNSFKNE
jgi:hypothetical protein